MPILEQDNLFNKLNEFITFMNGEFKQKCQESYGENVYDNYILPYIDDALSCIGEHISDIGTAMVDREYDYDDDEEDLYEDEEEEEDGLTEEEDEGGGFDVGTV